MGRYRALNSTFFLVGSGWHINDWIGFESRQGLARLKEAVGIYGTVDDGVGCLDAMLYIIRVIVGGVRPDDNVDNHSEASGG